MPVVIKVILLKRLPTLQITYLASEEKSQRVYKFISPCTLPNKRTTSKLKQLQPYWIQVTKSSSLSKEKHAKPKYWAVSVTIRKCHINISYIINISFNNSWHMRKCDNCLLHWSNSYHPFLHFPLTLKILCYATHLVRPKFT